MGTCLRFSSFIVHVEYQHEDDVFRHNIHVCTCEDVAIQLINEIKNMLINVNGEPISIKSELVNKHNITMLYPGNNKYILFYEQMPICTTANLPYYAKYNVTL